jgi:hypothetical protein
MKMPNRNSVDSLSHEDLIDFTDKLRYLRGFNNGSKNKGCYYVWVTFNLENKEIECIHESEHEAEDNLNQNHRSNYKIEKHLVYKNFYEAEYKTLIHFLKRIPTFGTIETITVLADQLLTAMDEDGIEVSSSDYDQDE